MVASIHDLKTTPVQILLGRIAIDGDLTVPSAAKGVVLFAHGSGSSLDAMAEMHGEVRLKIIPGATHLFEEPGALEQVATLAKDWFENHFLGNPRRN